MKYIWFGTTR